MQLGSLACRSCRESSDMHMLPACLLTLRYFFRAPSVLDDRLQVAVGGQHAALVTRNGKLYEWGAGVGGRLLAGSEATSPERVPTLWSRRCVSAGLWGGSCDGAVWWVGVIPFVLCP